MGTQGCRFDPNTSVGPATDPTEADGNPIDSLPHDAAVDGGEGEPDAKPCSFSEDALCLAGTPDEDWHISENTVLDTDSDMRCRVFSSAPQACLVLVDSLAIDRGVTLSTVGSRPLVIAAPGSILILGHIDVSSYRGETMAGGANFAGCANTSEPEADLGGAGGAAGGSFAGRGGDGGQGDADSSLGGNGTGEPGEAGPLVPLPVTLRGGCPGGNGANEAPGAGQGGEGGSGGGALRLVTPGQFQLGVQGSLRATGGGGGSGQVQSGGGGGGAGGMIVVEGGLGEIDGDMSANGGGGGEGGIRLNGNPRTGSPGENGHLSGTAASGGSGLSYAGNGGDGSDEETLQGDTGSEADGGGGGGGGSAGYLVVRGNLTLNGSSSPAVW